MKVKYRNQLEPEEFIALVELAKHAMDTMVAVVMRDKMQKAKRKREDDEVIDDLFEDDSEESYEELEEESEEVARPAPIPIPFEMKKAKKAAPPKPKLTSEMIEKGKEHFSELVHVWRINFDVDGADQPDRGEEIRQMASSMRGPLTLHFINEIGGLTLACQEVWGLTTLSQVMVELDCSELTGTPRVVAENMQQVASILFPPLASFLEYPNPLEIEC